MPAPTEGVFVRVAAIAQFGLALPVGDGVLTIVAVAASVLGISAVR